MRGKKIKGNKRHIIVDTLGLILAINIHTADIQDRVGARETINALGNKGIDLLKLWADGGYLGTLIEWSKKTWNIDLEIVKRTDKDKFVVLPKRWIVERTFAWLARYRRLAKDFERFTETGKAFIHLAMIRLMTTRLAKHYALT
jgi:transposase